MSEFVVYVHYIKGTDIPFYIGEGREYRALQSSGGRNQLYKLFESWYGGDYEIIMDGLSKVEAKEIEAKLIKELSEQYPRTITNTTHATNKKEPILVSKCGKFYSYNGIYEFPFRSFRKTLKMEQAREEYDLKIYSSLHELRQLTKNRAPADLWEIFNTRQPNRG